MSLNLSSDEEDFDEWETSPALKSAKQNPNGTPSMKPKAALTSPVIFEESKARSNSTSDSEEDDYDIDWQDVGQDTPGIDQKMPAREIQIDLGAVAPTMGDEEKEEQKNRKRKRRVTKLSNRFIPTELRELLVHLTRSHLLCLVASLVKDSRNSTDPDTLAVVTSLVPPRFSLANRPTIENLRFLSEEWLFPFLNSETKARAQQLRQNRAQGAPIQRYRLKSNARASASEISVIDYAGYLAMHHDENPQLYDNEKLFSIEPTPHLKALFVLALARSFCCRARLVKVVEPVRPVLDVDHPLLQSCADLFRQESSGTTTADSDHTHNKSHLEFENELTWIEILCADLDSKTGFRWVALDPARRIFNSPKTIVMNSKSPLAYAVGVEHNLDDGKFRLRDVTPRYATRWTDTLKQRGVRVSKTGAVDEMGAWWADTVQEINNSQQNGGGKSVHDAILLDDNLESEVALEVAEQEEFKKAAEQEKIPTNKAAFQNHPRYVIPSVLGKTEVLAPDAQYCGVFKGQLVYKRSDVSAALPRRKWLYQHRKVKSVEIDRPVKRVKARRKPASNSFKALKSYGVGSENDGSEEQRQRDLQNGTDPLSDGMQSLYAVWQTEKWSPPPVGPNDCIPVNEHRNIELALLNPGLVHIDQPKLAAVARKLGIQYAPCMLGFEGHGGNRTPTIRGIVVHKHNEAIMLEASAEIYTHEAEVNDRKRHRNILRKWRRLMVGVLTKDRLDREYGDEEK